MPCGHADRAGDDQQQRRQPVRRRRSAARPASRRRARSARRRPAPPAARRRRGAPMACRAGAARRRSRAGRRGPGRRNAAARSRPPRRRRRPGDRRRRPGPPRGRGAAGSGRRRGTPRSGRPPASPGGQPGRRRRASGRSQGLLDPRHGVHGRPPARRHVSASDCHLLLSISYRQLPASGNAVLRGWVEIVRSTARGRDRGRHRRAGRGPASWRRAGLDGHRARAGARPGGKMREVAIGGAPHRCRPDRVHHALGVRGDLRRRRRDARRSRHAAARLDVLARHAWSADERLDLFADIDRVGRRDRRLRRAGRGAGATGSSAPGRGGIYETLDAPFIRATQPEPRSA